MSGGLAAVSGLHVRRALGRRSDGSTEYGTHAGSNAPGSKRCYVSTGIGHTVGDRMINSLQVHGRTHRSSRSTGDLKAIGNDIAGSAEGYAMRIRHHITHTIVRDLDGTLARSRRSHGTGTADRTDTGDLRPCGVIGHILSRIRETIGKRIEHSLQIHRLTNSRCFITNYVNTIRNDRS